MKVHLVYFVFLGACSLSITRTPLVFAEKLAPSSSERKGEQPPSSEKENEQLVRNAWDTAVAIFSSSASPEEKKKEFHAWIIKYFDVMPSARFALHGRWKKLSSEQKKEYIRLFLEDMSTTYFTILSNYYQNDTLEIHSKATKKTSHGQYVFSEIKRQNGQVLSVKWRVRKKILDVIVNEASPSYAKREEYKEMIRKNGNTIEGFLEALKKKITSKK